MITKIDLFNQQNIKKKPVKVLITKKNQKKGSSSDLTPNLKPGDMVKIQLEVLQSDQLDKKSIKGKKTGSKSQNFEGTIIAVKHGQGINATFTVRGLVGGVAVERIFPLHSSTIKKIEIIRRSKVRRAKLYYLRKTSVKKTRLKKSN